MKTAAILGASGYAGGELIRLLDGHPEFEVTHLGAHTKVGTSLAVVHPHLAGGDRILGANDPTDVPDIDVAFLALPHGASAEPATALRARGIRVIDLGSDFRLDTPERYRTAYGGPHPDPEQLGDWIYGLPELFGAKLGGAEAVAVPGCYPTATLLALAPLVAAGLVETSGIVVDAVSGVTGAGRGLKEGLLFGSVHESVRAYAVGVHRHRPEMEMGLELASGSPASLVFTPHLVPMHRGILATCYARPLGDPSHDDLASALHDFYADATFVSVIDGSPETRWVVGSNRCLISVHLDEPTSTVIVISAIDNLLKGAAGQAVQCANLMLGFDESLGLPIEGWLP